MNKYSEVMEEVKLTDRMKQEIIYNVRYIRPGLNYKYVLGLACVVIALVMIMRYPQSDIGNSDDYFVGNEIVEMDDMSALESYTDMDILDMGYVPFDVLDNEYVAYGSDLAEVTYVGEDHYITYRQSLGQEDNSGDYTNYEEITELEFNDHTYTLKGQDDTYNLCLYSDDTYSYSIYSDHNLSMEQWHQIIQNIE